MKKTFVIALAGMLLFAFTQCGGTAKGSKEYQDNMKLLEESEKAFDEAKTCEELEEVALGFILSGFSDADYADEEKMTDEEEQKIKDYSKKILDDAEKRAKKMGCDQDE